MRHFTLFSPCKLLLLGTSLLTCALHAQALAASRPGAPRLLVVDVGAPTPDDDQSITHPHAGTWQGKPALLFVRQSEGARNLWLATPTNAAENSKDFEWVGRNMRWKARPLTQLPAPFSVQNPAFTRDGRILCTINAPALQVAPSVRNKPGKFRLALLNVEAGNLEFLTPARDDVNSAALAPGGARVAFSAQRAGRLAVFWMSLQGGPQYQIATEAQLSGWLDDNTLLYRSTRPGRGGLYRTNPLREEKGNDKAPFSARLLLADGRDAAISPDGRTICAVVATNNRSGVESESDATQLVYLSADGSGARVLKNTEGATHPAFTPDGNAIIFEDAAPAANSNADNVASDNVERTLWAMPMLRVPPVALLTALRPASVVQNANVNAGQDDALAIIGTAYSEESGPLQIKIEAGSGSAPARWTTVATREAAAQNETLALWTLPANARDEWTLRLTVRDASGDWAQSLLPVTLPLFAPLNPQTIAPTSSEIAAATAPKVAPSVAPPVNTPSRVTTPSAPVVTSPRQPVGSALPILPLPALPPPPTTIHPVLSPRAVFESSTANPSNNSDNDNNAVGNNTLPPFPVGALRAPEARPGEYAPPPVGNPPVVAPVAPATTKSASNKRPPRAAKTQTPTAAANDGTNSVRPVQAPLATPAVAVPSVGASENQRDRARLQIEALPSTMATGQKIEVDATLFNTSALGWKTSDTQPVRVFYRWVNRGTGTRRWWAYQWLRGDIAPGDNGKVTLSFTAPQAGRYRLSIGLLRLLPNNANVPAASDVAAQKLWPGEFATNSYEITVTP